MTQATEQPITISFPETTDLQLRITMGPGQLRITRGEGAEWVTGLYRDPTGSIPLRVESVGNKARIAQSVHFPSVPRPRGMPVLELRLGTGKPYSLVIEGGANELDAELGALPLTRLESRFGAGQASFRFSEPNPQPMERLQISAGAAEITASGIANANAADISIEGGAAALHLKFDGTLARDARARINVGAAGVDISVPGSTAAKISPHTVLAGVEVGDGFQTKDGAYWTVAAVAGETPVLTIDATIALAGLKLKAT